MKYELNEMEDMAVRAMIKNVQDPAERALMLNYRDALNEIRRALALIYEKYAEGGKLTLAEMSKFNRLRNLEQQIRDIMGPVFGRDGTLIDKLATVQFQQAYYRYGWAIEQESGAALRWGMLRPEAIKAAVMNPAWRKLHDIAIKGAKEQALNAIDRTVTQGLIQGHSYQEMARQIKAVMDTSAGRAMTIARTEGGRAQTLGQQEAYSKAQDQGVDVVQVWDATLDGRTRPDHGALDGVEGKKHGDWEYAWQFESTGGWTPGPRLSGDPSQDINCRCRVRGKVAGLSPKLRRIKGEGVVPYKTYSEWAKEKALKPSLR